MGIPGRIGRYELLELLGRGGMADVYLARVRGLADFERRFVVKMIRTDVEDPQRFGAYFIDEARITVHLQHPNITQVFDLGLFEDKPYLGMEYIDGPDLKQFVDWSRELRGGVPFHLATFIGREVLQGLAYAHEARRPDGSPMAIVHRDISPHNILLARNGGVKLCDFGVAQATIASQAQGAGFVVGKPAYIAPEIARGEAATARSDLFSLGATLFYLFTGEMMIEAATYEAVLMRLARFDIDERLDQVMSLPTGLEPVLRGMLQTDPGARFDSAQAALDHLEDYIYAEGVRGTRNELATYLAALDARIVRDEPSVGDMLGSADADDDSESGVSFPIQESESWSGMVVQPGERDPDGSSGSGSSLISGREFAEKFGGGRDRPAEPASGAMDATVARPADWKPALPDEPAPDLPPGWDTSEMLVLPDADRVTIFDVARGPRTLGGEDFDDLLEEDPPELETLLRFDDSEIRPYAEWIQEGNPRADVTRSALPLDVTPLTIGSTLGRLLGHQPERCALQFFSGRELVVLFLDRGWVCGAWNESIGPELMEHLVARGSLGGAQLDVLQALARKHRRSLAFVATQRRLITGSALQQEAREIIAEHVRRLVEGPAWRVNSLPTGKVGWGRDRVGRPLVPAMLRAAERRFTVEWFLGLHAGLIEAPLTVDTERLESQTELRLSRSQIQLAWSIHRGTRVQEVITGAGGDVDPARARDLYLLILAGVVLPYLTSDPAGAGAPR